MNTTNKTLTRYIGCEKNINIIILLILLVLLILLILLVLLLLFILLILRKSINFTL